MSDPSAPVACPQCKTEYLIVFPDSGPIVACLSRIDHMVSTSCPFIAAGVVVGTVYWTAVTYGAVTIMQVCGLCRNFSSSLPYSGLLSVYIEIGYSTNDSVCRAQY